jgi:hypothetical protein
MKVAGLNESNENGIALGPEFRLPTRLLVALVQGMKFPSFIVVFIYLGGSERLFVEDTPPVALTECSEELGTRETSPMWRSPKVRIRIW